MLGAVFLAIVLVTVFGFVAKTATGVALDSGSMAAHTLCVTLFSTIPASDLRSGAGRPISAVMVWYCG